MSRLRRPGACSSSSMFWWAPSASDSVSHAVTFASVVAACGRPSAGATRNSSYIWGAFWSWSMCLRIAASRGSAMRTSFCISAKAKTARDFCRGSWRWRARLRQELRGGRRATPRSLVGGWSVGSRGPVEAVQMKKVRENQPTSIARRQTKSQRCTMGAKETVTRTSQSRAELFL